MSGYEPGRPKIEGREAHLIWKGTRILTEHGVESTVDQVWRGEDGMLTIKTVRVIEDFLFVSPTDLIRCRVEEEDR